MEQDIRFCTASDGTRIAYARSGQGPPLVRAAHWLTHLEFDWQSPIWRPWLDALGRHQTVVRYDERGCGLSDWNVADLSFAAWVDDLEAVVQAAGLERFGLLGISQGGPIAMTYAARHPERVTHLVLYGTYVRGRLKRNPTPQDIEEIETLERVIRLGWGRENPAFRQVFTSLFLPEGTTAQIQAFNELQRISTSPENAARIVSGFNVIDVESLAPKIRVPTLVLHARGDGRIPFEEGRRTAALIPGARFVPLDGKNHILLEQEPAWSEFLREVFTFLGVGADDASTKERSDRWSQADRLFDRALDLPQEERSRWLAEACGQDEDLRLEVERLLSLSDSGDDLLNTRRRKDSLWQDAARQIDSGLGEETLPPGARIGAYQIVEKLGSGGMGTVYRAKHPELEREVAVKSLSGVFRADRSSLERFRREAKLLAALNHPNIAAIYDIVLDKERPFLILELVSGSGLDEMIKNGPLERERVVDIAVQIAEALLEAHGKGVVHRDLKPGNVKVRADGRVKVLDFGLAKSVQPESNSGSFETRSDVILGTPSYMSPEQARGERVDEKTDIWALGCVVFEMLVGRPPFVGRSAPEVLSAVLRDPMPRLPAGVECPAALHRVVERCLEKNPEDRYATVDELVGDLRGSLDAPSRPPIGLRAAIGLGLLALVSLLALLVLLFQ